MFFFLTLYMQNVLGYSPIQTGAAYLPLTFGVAVSAGISSQLLARIGTRPVIVVGALIAAAGLYYLSRVPVDGSYLTDLFPGLMIVSFGLGAVFVAITTAANAGVPSDKAGLAAALLNASQQVGGALGLAIFSRDRHVAHQPSPRRPRDRARRAHLGLSPSPAGQRHLRARHRDPRATHQQHARRRGPNRRGGGPHTDRRLAVALARASAQERRVIPQPASQDSQERT
jgi:hypothetical protein